MPHDDQTPAPPTPDWGAAGHGAGTAFAVWAPAATSVSLAHDDGSFTAMKPTGHGWHEVLSERMAPGSRYRFSMDGNAVPDPASRCQPEGIFGFGEVVDPAGYRWGDGSWRGRAWTETVLYELHVGTFSAEGTFLGAIAHLDHLAALGITMIELMPVATFAGARNWGYDGVMPYAPHFSYGAPDDLKRLVDECHRRGMSVMLDVVYNHFGPEGNWLPGYAPAFFTNRHKTPWGEAIDFDGPDSAAVRAFFIENALYWLVEFHFDGLRLDAVQAVFDDGAIHILDELAQRARAAAVDRRVHLVVENDNNDARWLARGCYDAQWNDDFHHVMRVLLTGRRDGYYRDYADEPLERLGRVLAEGFCYQGEESVHRPGLLRGTRSAQLPATAFVNFIQNHDQVGNTPFGCRISDLAPQPVLELGTAIMLLAPGIPMFFMGQEWASARPFDFFCDFPNPLADAVRKGRRDEFSHLPEFQDPAAVARLTDPNAAATRDGSVLDWENVTQPRHANWLAFHRRLLEARRECLIPYLGEIGGHAGRFRVVHGVLEVRWELADRRMLVMAANFAPHRLAWEQAGSTLFRLIASEDAQHLAAWDLTVSVLAA